PSLAEPVPGYRERESDIDEVRQIELDGMNEPLRGRAVNPVRTEDVEDVPHAEAKPPRNDRTTDDDTKEYADHTDGLVGAAARHVGDADNPLRDAEATADGAPE